MSAALEVRHLHYRYAEGPEALRGVSFSVAGGECVGLIGPNGAGKSTLLLHLNGLLPHDLGRGHHHEHQHGHLHHHHAHGAGHHEHHHDEDHDAIFVNGRLVGPETLHEVRRQVGLLFQDPNDQLFCPTVFEDVAFGPQQFGLGEGELRERVAQALARAGLPGFETRAPHHLSVGEKRRVCLAGVLACDPSILVLDEPSSSLDPRGRRELKDLLRQIPITKLIATHDLELVVELCARVIVLDAGEVVAEGPTVRVLSDEALMLRHHLECPHILHHRHPHGGFGPGREP
jgi:energy-coupling factor transporter ATP-binding protein EcfA2